MALNNEKKKQEAARSSASGSSAALRNAAQMIPAAQQQNATSSTQTGKMPTVSAAKQESSGTTVSMPSVRSAASVIPTAQKAQTARQKMLYQQEEQPKWYSGETPTRSEAQAQIYRISQQDPAKGKQLFDAFQTFQADPSNPMYNPYTKATSNAVQHLSDLGYDLSGGFSQDWLDQNAALKNYYRTTTGTTPLAPSSSSTPEQDAAYWYYKAQNDEATTQKAETEWQALQDEIAYWTNRTDRNYSDDEILAKIDWKNYSTLTGMDEDAAKGTPTQLTRPVGYSQDALRGVIWATRNGVTTDDGNNSVRAALGQGNKWKENSEISQKLDPASEYYSPYSVSSTLDDAAIYFGVDSFGKDWLTENRDVLSGDDKTAKTMYTKVYNAEQTTLEAESELAELNQLVDKYCERYDDSETVLKYLANRVDEDFPTLAKLDKGIASGSLVSTTRPIAYSWGDVRRTVQQRIDAKNNATPAAQTMGKALGVTADENPTFDAITSAAKHNVSEAADLIEQSGTDAEKRKVLTAGTPEFNTLVQSVSDMMAKVKAKADKVYQDQQKALYNTSRNTQAMNDAAAVGGALARQNLPSSPVNFGEIVAQSILEKGKHQEYTSAANSAFASVANRSDLTAAQRQKLNGIIQGMSQSTAETAETPAQTVSPSPYQESNLPDANKGTIGRERNKLTATAEEAAATDETAQVQDAEKSSRDSLPETTREKRSTKEFQKPEAESPELATARQEVLNALLDAQNAQNAQEYENTVRGALEDAIGIKSRENMTLGEYASQPLQGVTAARNARNTELLNVMNRQDEMYVADAYLWALEWIAPYQQADKERAELQAELDAMIESDPWITSSLNIRAYYNENKYDPSSQSYTYEKTLREAQTLQKRILNVEEKMSGLEENYHKGESILDNIGRKYQRSMLLSNVPGGKPMDTTMVDVLTYVYNYGTNYQPTTWSAYSNMESALTSGENAETVAKYADDVETAAKQGIESIDAIIEYLDEKDVVLPNGETTYINNLRRQQKLFRQELDGVEYWRLQQNADFKEKAEEAKRDIQENASSYINPSVGDVFKAIGESTGWFGDYSVEDVQIANFDEIRKAYDPNNLAAHGYDGNYNYMTENERNTYLYLRETEGKEAATAYYKYLQDNVLSVRAYESATEFTKEKTHDDHIGMTIASVLMSPSQVMGTLYSIGQVIKGEEINPYNVAFAGSSFVNTVRNTTKEDMSVAVDDWMGDNPAKGFVKWLSTAAYDAATSAGDSALNSVLFGNALSGIATNALAREGMSKGAQFAVRALAGFAGASPMGLQAAGAAMQDVKFRGGSDEQALMIGLINFGAETITEAITLDNIQETFHAASAGEAKGFLKTILHSALEEAPGEAINELVEGLGDDWIMGSLSNHNLEIAEYERQGMTHEQAVRKAGFNFFLDCLNAGIVGGLSGSMSSSVSYGAGKAKNKYNQHKANKALESVVHEAFEANEQQNGEQTTEQTTPTETQENPASEQDTTAQEEGQTEQQPTESPAEQQTTQEESSPETEEAPAETVQTDEQDNEEKLTRIAALGNVDLIQDTSMQTAIIANSLLNAEGTNLDVASTTAETLAFVTSPQEAANTVSDLLTVASTENVRMTDVQEALANAVLGNGQAAQAFDTIKRDGVSKETMHALMEASAQDRANQQVQDEVAVMVRENAIAKEVVRMIGDGALNGLRTYEAAVNKAQTALVTAQAQLEQAQAKVKAVGDNFADVMMQYHEDTANAALTGMVQQAINDVKGANLVAQQAQQTLQNRQTELQEARETLNKAQEEALSRVRQEAIQTVTEAARQEEVTRQQAAAQEAAQTALQTPTQATEQVTTQTDEQTATKEQGNLQNDTTNRPKAFIGKANSAEITQQLQNNGKVISGDQLLNTLEQLTGVPIDKRKKKYLRELRPTTQGYSYAETGTTHIQDANNVSAAIHEYGHVFDEMFKLAKQFGNEAINGMVAKMRNNSFGLDVEAYTASELRTEAVAEFVRRWFYSRQMAVQFGGEAAVKILENELNKKGWLRGFQEASEAFKLNRSSTDTDRAIASIMLDPPKAAKQKYQRGLDNLIRKLFDHAHPLRQISYNMQAQEKAKGKEHNYALDPYALERMRVPVTGGMLESMIAGNGLVDMEGNLVLKEDGTPYGSLADILHKYKVQLKDERLFNAFWAALHAQSRQSEENMGSMGIKEVFGEDIDPDAVVQDLEAKHPEWRSCIEEIENWYEEFQLTWAIRNHLVDMTEEEYHMLRAIYPYYVPTYRVGRNGENRSGKGLTTEADPGNTIFKRAVGGTEMIYNPLMGLAENIQNTIAAAKRVEVYRSLNYNFRKGNTELGMIEDTQPDLTITSNREANSNARQALNEALQQIRYGQISPEINEFIQHSLDNLPSQTFTEEETASGGDVLNFRDENGDMVRLTIYNKALFESMQDMKPIHRSALVKAVRGLTNFLAANATTHKAVFVLQNMFGDVETAINTGKGSMWARNYPVYWAKELAAGMTVLKNEINSHRENGQVSQEYADFLMFGHLQSKYALREGKTQKQIRQSLYAKNKGLNPAKIANATKAIIAAPITSTETLAGISENTTRFNEFELAKTKEEKERGYSTYSDKLRRGMNAHEATTDFTMYGTSKSMQALKIAIPFLNASAQGLYKTTQTFTKANAGQRASILARQAVNCILTSMLVAAIKNATWSDEEKEAYEEVSDYEKNKYWHFKIDGDLAKYFGSDFLKIKRSQDSFVQLADAIGTFLGDTLTGYEGDALGDFMGSINEIVMNAIPNHNMSWQALVDGWNNVTYFGSSITNYADSNVTATERYDSDTSPWARGISNTLSGFGVDLSPKQVDYIVQQYTGSLGQIGGDLIIAATDGKLNGETMLNIFSDRIMSGFTYDPVKQNQLTSKFYDNYTTFDQIVAEAGQNGTTSLLRSDLTTEEQKAAVEEARAMTKKGGIMKETQDEISVIYDRIDEILANETMSRYDKQKACDELYAQRNKLAMAANIAAGDYMNKYGYNNNAVRAFHNNSILFGLENKAPYEAATDYDLMPDVFKEAADTREMKFAQAAWEASATDPSARKSTLLPHPQTNFSKDKIKYEMEGAGQEAYNEAYWNAYSDYLTDKPLEATDDPDKQEEWLNAAHKKGMAAGQAAYLEWLDQKQ